MTRYLNITGATAYLFVMEKSVLEKNHKKYFGFYIAYAKKLLDAKSMGTGVEQSEYWQYIKLCVEKHDMQSDKTVPCPAKEYYRILLERSEKKK